MHILPQKSPWYCSYKSLLLESDKDKLQKSLTPNSQEPVAETTASNPPFILICYWPLPSQLKKLKPEFSGVADSLDCQTTPLPAPGAAMKTNPQKANPLPIPPSWFQLHNKPNQGRLSGQFLISSELPLPDIIVLGTYLPVGYHFWFITLQCLKFFPINDSSSHLDSPELWYLEN